MYSRQMLYRFLFNNDASVHRKIHTQCFFEENAVVFELDDLMSPVISSIDCISHPPGAARLRKAPINRG